MNQPYRPCRNAAGWKWWRRLWYQVGWRRWHAIYVLFRQVYNRDLCYAPSGKTLLLRENVCCGMSIIETSAMPLQGRHCSCVRMYVAASLYIIETSAMPLQGSHFGWIYQNLCKLYIIILLSFIYIGILMRWCSDRLCATSDKIWTTIKVIKWQLHDW